MVVPSPGMLCNGHLFPYPEALRPRAGETSRDLAPTEALGPTFPVAAARRGKAVVGVATSLRLRSFFLLICTGVRRRDILGTCYGILHKPMPESHRGALSASGAQGTEYYVLWCRIFMRHRA